MKSSARNIVPFLKDYMDASGNNTLWYLHVLGIFPRGKKCGNVESHRAKILEEFDKTLCTSIDPEIREVFNKGQRDYWTRNPKCKTDWGGLLWGTQYCNPEGVYQQAEIMEESAVANQVLGPTRFVRDSLSTNTRHHVAAAAEHLHAISQQQQQVEQEA
jgi:hypothetical protein